MKENREQRFIQAYQEHSDALFRYCYFKVSNREIALDLLQETFMKVWLYISKGEEIQNLRAFLYRTLSNLIIDEYRRKKTVSLDSMMEAGFDRGFNATKDLENQIDGAKALEMLKQIPEMYRDVIFMRYVQEFSLKEIAEITGESENAIAVKVHRGLDKVRKIFNHEQ